VGWGERHWIALFHDRDGWQPLVDAVMKYRVPQNGGKFLTG
jgi:hypothetical protein